MGVMERAHRYIHLNLHSADLTLKPFAGSWAFQNPSYQLFEPSAAC